MKPFPPQQFWTETQTVMIILADVKIKIPKVTEACFWIRLIDAPKNLDIESESIEVRRMIRQVLINKGLAWFPLVI